MADELATISVFFGSDEGQSAAGAHAAFQQLTAGGDGWGDEIIEATVATVDESVATIQRCINGLQTMNMFGGRKVIWLKAANFMGDSPQGTKSDYVVAALENLLAALGNLPADTFLVISATEMDKRRSFYKKLSGMAQMHESQKIDISKAGWEDELAALVKRLAAPHGLSFTPAALDLFVHRVHESTRQIGNELDKFAVYLGKDKRAIEERDVELMVAVSRQGIIFEISRAIERGDARQAIRLVNEQLESGESAVSIMRAALVPTVRNRYVARLLMEHFGKNLNPDNYRSFESGLSRLPDEARKLLPLKKDGTPNAFGLINAAKTCRKLTLPQAHRALKACAEADRNLVSTSADPYDVLHKLIVTITA